MNPEAPKKLPTPAQDWSTPMGIAGLVNAMCSALTYQCWAEAAKLARQIELRILDEGTP